MRFLPWNCVAVFVIKEYRRGVTKYMHGLYVVKVLNMEVAVVVKHKCKKSKITWIIMNAFQFSTMHTIVDAFLGIRSKVLTECAQ